MTFAALAASAAPAGYDCTYLVDPGIGNDAMPTAINQDGTIVGYSAFPWPEIRRAVVWKGNGKVLVLPTLGANVGSAHGINDKGQVVGTDKDEDGHFRAVRWRHGKAKALPSPPGPLASDEAAAINNNGDVVGRALAADSMSRHAALWRGGEILDLGALGGPKGQRERSSLATDINDAGVIVGQSQVRRRKPAMGMHAVRWDDPETIVDLGALPGGVVSKAQKINNTGTIAGYSEYEAGGDTHVHATAWDAGGIHDLGALPGDDTSIAWGLNDAAVVVGVSGGALPRAVAWFGLTQPATDLNTLVSEAGCRDTAGRSYLLQQARAVNNAGVIAAMGMSDSDGGRFAAFRLTPR